MTYSNQGFIQLLEVTIHFIFTWNSEDAVLSSNPSQTTISQKSEQVYYIVGV